MPISWAQSRRASSKTGSGSCRHQCSWPKASALAAGLQRTGRIITSAPLILAVVIGAFASSGIVFITMIGVGLVVAILVDATVVRALLVPATMRLLGSANWGAPTPLRRCWERYGVRESADQARPVLQTAPTSLSRSGG